MPKTDPELLLDLAEEYRASVDDRTLSVRTYGGGDPTGRDPAMIAAEYAEVLRRVVQA